MNDIIIFKAWGISEVLLYFVEEPWCCFFAFSGFLSLLNYRTVSKNSRVPSKMKHINKWTRSKLSIKVGWTYGKKKRGISNKMKEEKPHWQTRKRFSSPRLTWKRPLVIQLTIGSLSNHDDDGNKNPTNLHNWQWKTVFLHALHVHFSFFDIL